MDNKYRQTDEASTCIMHKLTDDGKRFDDNVVGVLVEVLVKEVGELVVECRDTVHVTPPSSHIKQYSVADSKPAGRTVVTVFSKEQSNEFWDTCVMPKAKVFCQIMQRLMADDDWQKSYMQVPDRKAWYEQAVQSIQGNHFSFEQPACR